MKVSIITVCYNSELTIEDTIQSVFSQNYKDIEYIVVDGVSKDNTLNIIHRYQDKISHFISEPDSGIYDAMNKGLSLATGDIIGILNSDDIFSSNDSIANIVSGFEDPTVDAVYGDLIYVAQNDLDKITRAYSDIKFSKLRLKFGLMVPHPTFYIRKNIINALGYYKTDYEVAADFEYVARFYQNGYKAKRIPLILVKMREGGASSCNFISIIRHNFEIVRACKENGIWTTIFLIAMKTPYKLLTLTARWRKVFSS